MKKIYLVSDKNRKSDQLEMYGFEQYVGQPVGDQAKHVHQQPRRNTRRVGHWVASSRTGIDNGILMTV